ncbi:MAG TPA: YraN family protein [Verrucomicrobiae bacterium]|nr:YraN family protein [Verrucomicrobiae bacterium]
MRFKWFKRSSKPYVPHLDLGARGEQIAAKYLRRHGYKILVRNFRSRKAEVDIVARHKDWLVFVEVKTRESEQFGFPSEAVDREKQRNLTKAALDYLRLLGNPQIHFRFDIVEVVMPEGARQPDDVRLIPNAFDLSEPYIY